ncbi:MAG: TIGR00282 family metallophosphoesterase [Rectinema sp.]
MAITILYLGEIVGKTGVFTVRKTLPALRERYKPDFVMANADSATGGGGIGVQHAVYLRKLGVDCLTMGEGAYYKRDMTDYYPRAPWVLRPANYSYDNPGRGWKVFESPAGRVAVLVLLGQAGFPRVHLANPFEALESLAERIRKETPFSVLDFHAATSAEKRTMAFWADGKVSAVIGSHGKALTADARILPGGAAALTDCGRTGSLQSVGGLDPDQRLREFRTGLPLWASDGALGLEAQGCVLGLDGQGRAVSFETFRHPCKEKLDD